MPPAIPERTHPLPPGSNNVKTALDFYLYKQQLLTTQWKDEDGKFARTYDLAFAFLQAETTRKDERNGAPFRKAEYHEPDFETETREICEMVELLGKMEKHPLGGLPDLKSIKDIEAGISALDLGTRRKLRDEIGDIEDRLAKNNKTNEVTTHAYNSLPSFVRQGARAIQFQQEIMTSYIGMANDSTMVKELRARLEDMRVVSDMREDALLRAKKRLGADLVGGSTVGASEYLDADDLFPESPERADLDVKEGQTEEREDSGEKIKLDAEGDNDEKGFDDMKREVDMTGNINEGGKDVE